MTFTQRVTIKHALFTARVSYEKNLATAQAMCAQGFTEALSLIDYWEKAIREVDDARDAMDALTAKQAA
ncbi:MAG: hypothetical protein C5B60_09125 [Chloroflexi bacterium]|nr:MAG: hypothetical protein C5B60_09125 [Chloroflexota bacterium]